MQIFILNITCVQTFNILAFPSRLNGLFSNEASNAFAFLPKLMNLYLDRIEQGEFLFAKYPNVHDQMAKLFYHITKTGFENELALMPTLFCFALSPCTGQG